MLVFPRVLALSVVIGSWLAASPAASQSDLPSLGIFQGTTDVGATLRGSSTYDGSSRSYRVQGGGEDVWGAADQFRFTWKRVSGDSTLHADLHIDAPVTFRLAKGMLLFRQSLDPGSPYADVALHADGHVTLQYRLVPGGDTKDITLPEHNVSQLRIVRHGNTFTAYAGMGSSQPAKAAITVPMPGTVYVGLGVCSHNVDALQSVTFTRVSVDGAAR